MMKLFAKISAAACALVLAAAPLTAFAEGEDDAPADPAAELFSYGTNEDGTITLYDFIPSADYEGEVVIPSVIDGQPVTRLSNAVFQNAAGVTKITIPASVNDLGNSVFHGCTNVTEYVVEEGNTYLSAVDGVLFADNGGMLVAYPAAREDETYTIPESVDELGPSCFSSTLHLREITVPDTVNYIDAWAFSYSGLEKIDISGSVVQIDDYAFAYDASLHEVTLHEGTETIYNAAFLECRALEEITFPSTVTYVGQYCFAGTSMKSVVIPATLGEIDYCAFGYDGSMNAIGGFTIYGETGSAAESYCTAIDEENDYENHFVFISLDSLEATDEGSVQETSGAQSGSAQETAAQQEDAGTQEPKVPGAADQLGTATKNNTFLQIVLITLGGIAAVLAVVLIVLVVKKPKPPKPDDPDKAEGEEAEEEDEDA